MPRRAVVIGAGLAGMLAAAALAGAADEVVVLDADALPDGPEHRKGLPQGRHAHILMAGGLAAMEELVPGAGVRKRLLAAGAHELSLGRDMVVLTPEGWFRRWRHEGPALLACTRALLDWTVRDAVVTQAPVRVEVRPGTRVAGLLGGAGRVTGVRFHDSGDTRAGGGEDRELTADFVVDASGRGSRVTHWLAALGVTAVRERTVDTGLVNATRLYRAPEGAGRFPVTVVQADPYVGRPGRSGMILPVEDGRWMVSLAGTRGAEPPGDVDGFLRYAMELADPLVGRFIARAEPLTDVWISRSTHNHRRYLEKVRDWPEGLVVLGDALAMYNPAYGQGMSVAALGARLLAEEVRRAGGGLGSAGLAARVQRGVVPWVDAAWSAAVGQDVWYPQTRGARPTPVDRLVTAYSRRLTKGATGAYGAAAALWEVTSLLAPPTRLFTPGTLLTAALGPLLPPQAGAPLTAAERSLLAP
ncbi:NAD(P)/FAD-dependent oxidoreductase [Streptomyces longwoodensis]|uniref:NAD(P)/FAD-dependent oxidoreductase n=1 Tax=Streptomyces longwoodensis TaxID=68231 RepID=UPI0037B192D6